MVFSMSFIVRKWSGDRGDAKNFVIEAGTSSGIAILKKDIDKLIDDLVKFKLDNGI